eukprot:gene4696-8268_t
MQRIFKPLLRKYSTVNQETQKIKINKRAILGFNILGLAFAFNQYSNSFEKEKKIFEKFIEDNQIEIYNSAIETGMDCIHHTVHTDILNSIFEPNRQNDIQVVHTDKIFSDHLISIKMKQFVLPTICHLSMNELENKLTTTECTKPWRFDKKNIDFYFPICITNSDIFVLKVGLKSQKIQNLNLSPTKEPPELFISKISICDPRSVEGMIKWLKVNNQGKKYNFGKWNFDTNEVIIEEAFSTDGIKQRSDGISIAMLTHSKTQSLPLVSKT